MKKLQAATFMVGKNPALGAYFGGRQKLLVTLSHLFLWQELVFKLSSLIHRKHQPSDSRGKQIAALKS